MSAVVAHRPRASVIWMRKAVSLAAALVATAALAAIAHRLTRRAPLDPAAAVATATAALGFLLMGGWLAGRLASKVGLPALTGQLLAGICAGPSVASALAGSASAWGLESVPTLVSAQDIRYLGGINALAVAMIGIAAGGELELGHLRRIARRVIAIVIIEMPAVGLAAAGALAIASSAGLAALGTDVPLPLACMLTGCLMMASSPAVAIALMREQGRTGEFAQFAMALIVAKDIVLTVVFTGVLVAGARIVGAASGATPVPTAPGTVLAWHLLGSLALGAVLSAPLALVLRRVERRMDMVAVVVAALVAALARSVDLSPLLVALTLGIALRTGSPRGSRSFFAATGRTLLPVCCIFFALTGAKLDVMSIWSALPATAAICGARMAAAWAGATAGATIAGLEPRSRRWIWACLVPQAGVAIALASEVGKAFEGLPWAAPLTALLISCVAMNEVVGPPLMRIALRRAQ
jgi:Kef-type K+ transport system membrane component KefB